MPKAISCNPSTGQPVNTPQQQENTVATPTDAALGDAAQPPNSSPIYFPPADPFESEEEPEVPAASMAVSEPQQSERGTVTAVTSARKTKYTGQKKSGTNLTQRQPSRPTSKRQTIAAGKRVFVERKIVKYRLDVDSPGYEVVQLYQSDKFRFYGTVVGKPANSKLYKVQLDLLPSDANEVLIVRKDITVLAKGEEEPPYNPQHEAMVDNCGVVPDRPAARKSRDHIGDSYNAFSKLESGLQAMASSFEMTYGDGSDDKIIWRVLSEKEQITVCPMEEEQASNEELQSNKSPFLKDIPWDRNPSNVDYNSILFGNFFPSLEGKAAILDEYLRHTGLLVLMDPLFIQDRMGKKVPKLGSGSRPVSFAASTVLNL
jgi:hypothetical protein